MSEPIQTIPDKCFKTLMPEEVIDVLLLSREGVIMEAQDGVSVPITILYVDPATNEVYWVPTDEDHWSLFKGVPVENQKEVKRD